MKNLMVRVLVAGAAAAALTGAAGTVASAHEPPGEVASRAGGVPTPNVATADGVLSAIPAPVVAGSAAAGGVLSAGWLASPVAGVATAADGVPAGAASVVGGVPSAGGVVTPAAAADRPPAATSGVASAAGGVPGGVAAAAGGTPIWVLPGVDLGAVLDPTIGVPGALAPVFDLLKLIGA